MTRCKFKCESVTKKKHWDTQKEFLYDYSFTPVIGDSEENRKFWAATPGGRLEVYTVNADIFIPGKEYYLDISEA